MLSDRRLRVWEVRGKELSDAEELLLHAGQVERAAGVEGGRGEGRPIDDRQPARA